MTILEKSMKPTAKPPNELVINAGSGGASCLEILSYRDLLTFFARRDIVIRYRHMAVGLAWVLIKPLASMAIFLVIFGKLARLPAHGFPYSLVVLAGLVPWQFFATTVGESSMSIVNNAPLLTKVYFPRMLLPLAVLPVNLLDLGVALLVLVAFMLFMGQVPAWTVILLPLFTLPLLAFAFGCGLWVSALMARFRDLKNVLPFTLQLLMFCSPTAFVAGIVPEKWRLLLSLNPLTGVIEGWRWCLFGPAYPLNPRDIVIGAAVAACALFSGYAYFKNTERDFSDVI